VDGAAATPDGVVRPHLVGVAIYKMTGSGNDFVMVDTRHTSPDDWAPADIRAVCARGTGVGADGLVFVGPGSRPQAVRMIYYNADGSPAAMCGNAALCATRLAARLGLAPAREMLLETDAGTYVTRCGADGDRAELGVAAVAAPVPVPGLGTLADERRAAFVTVGVPHLVVLVDDVDRVDVRTRGRALRCDPALGAGGANVNFVAPGAGPEEWRMRTYERGVEDETLACGTGAVAAACALLGWDLAASPLSFRTRSGRRLDVRAARTADGSYDDLWLSGEARVVLRGVIS